MNPKLPRKTRGEHGVTVYISFELKERLHKLAKKYDRTMADMIRAIIRVGIPVMEGIGKAEEIMLKEYLQLFRKFRKIKNLKEI